MQTLSGLFSSRHHCCILHDHGPHRRVHRRRQMLLLAWGNRAPNDLFLGNCSTSFRLDWGGMLPYQVSLFQAHRSAGMSSPNVHLSRIWSRCCHFDHRRCFHRHLHLQIDHLLHLERRIRFYHHRSHHHHRYLQSFSHFACWMPVILSIVTLMPEVPWSHLWPSFPPKTLRRHKFPCVWQPQLGRSGWRFQSTFAHHDRLACLIRKSFRLSYRPLDLDH